MKKVILALGLLMSLFAFAPSASAQGLNVRIGGHRSGVRIEVGRRGFGRGFDRGFGYGYGYDYRYRGPVFADPYYYAPQPRVVRDRFTGRLITIYFEPGMGCWVYRDYYGRLRRY